MREAQASRGPVAIYDLPVSISCFCRDGVDQVFIDSDDVDHGVIDPARGLARVTEGELHRVLEFFRNGLQRLKGSFYCLDVLALR